MPLAGNVQETRKEQQQLSAYGSYRLPSYHLDSFVSYDIVLYNIELAAGF